MIKRLGHVGVVVKDLEKALRYHRDIFGLEKVASKTLEGVAKVAFIPVGDGEIELIQPLDPNSPLGKFVLNHGEGVHHIALETDNIDAEMEKMKKEGIEFVTDKPYVGAHGVRIAFIRTPAYGLQVELCQEQV